MKKSKKLVFFGNERLATATTTNAPSLRALAEAGYEIEAVIASHVDGVSRQKRDLEIGPVAQKHKIPVILPGEKIELAEKVKKHPADAAILVAFGQIIPQAVIDLFPDGIINVHPSILPKYRGPTPIETAILNDDRQTGVSLMMLVKEMDAGPVFAQKTIKLHGNETKQALAEKLATLGSQLLMDNLAAILDGRLKPKKQIESSATYTKLIQKQDELMDFSQPANILERQVRAYAGWPKSRAKIFGYDVIITKARVANDRSDGDLVMSCGPGPDAEGSGLRPERRSWLEIQQLTAPSGRTMSSADFLRGYRK